MWSDIKQHELVYFVHLKNDFMCIVRAYHEFHANVSFPAIYAHLLPNGEILQILCDNRIKTQNIVGTLRK